MKWKLPRPAARAASRSSRFDCPDSRIGQKNLLHLAVFLVEEPDISDAVYELRLREAGELAEDGVALPAIADARAQLHELVVLEREAQLLGDTGREPLLADEHDRMQRVAEPAQV